MDYGIQLYSVRDLAEKDLSAAVKRVAELGYSSVEFAGFFGHSAEEVNEMLRENNLRVSSTHSGFDDLVNNYDVIIGPIADDRMNTCFKRFIENALTDEGLEACLKSVNYGKQYVLKTPFACSKVDIISSYEMTEEEKHSIQTHNYNLQLDGDKVVRNAVIAYRNQGLYLDQIIAKEQELQNNREIDDYERE